MCEIQFIKNLAGNLTPKDLTEFKNLMEFGSLYNGDAWGIFNHNYNFKKSGNFDKKGFEKAELLKENFLVGHNRYKTSGSQEQNFNNHPFMLEDFVLVHNGVLSNFTELKTRFKISNKIQTDSFIILWLVNHYFKKSKLTDRTKKMAWAIQKTTSLIAGSYSVFVYDKVSRDLFYFKNANTDFEFCLLDDRVLLGSTNEENLNNIYLNKKYIFDVDDCNKIFKTPNNNTIYLINDKVVIKEIDVFKEHIIKKVKVVVTPTPITQQEFNFGVGGGDYGLKGVYDDYAGVSDDYDNMDIWAEVDFNLNQMFGKNMDFKIVNNDEVMIKTKDLNGFFFTKSRTKKKKTYIPIEELLKDL